MKIFDDKNWDFSISKIFVGRFQNSLIMVLINRFGQNFVQNYVEFNGGGRGIKSKANGVRGRPLQKKGHSYKKRTLFVRFVQNTYVLGLGIWLAYSIFWDSFWSFPKPVPWCRKSNVDFRLALELCSSSFRSLMNRFSIGWTFFLMPPTWKTRWCYYFCAISHHRVK